VHSTYILPTMLNYTLLKKVFSFQFLNSCFSDCFVVTQVKPHFVHEYPVFEDGKKGLWVKSGLEMDTDANSFRGGRLKLKCIASVFSASHRASEVQIEEEKPRSASVKAGSNKEPSGNQQANNKPGQQKKRSF
jgi:hypothetical protein